MSLPGRIHIMNTSTTPESWGWKREFHSAWIAALDAGSASGSTSGPGAARPLIPARVVGREHHQYELAFPDFSDRLPLGSISGSEWTAGRLAGRQAGIRITGRFEYEAGRGTDFPVTGDWVLVDPAEAAARIHAILPRKSALSRGEAGDRGEEQVLAANIDSLLIVSALDGGRNFLPRFLERACVIAYNAGASPIIVLNKIDLADRETLDLALAAASRAAPAAPAVAVSARKREGLEELRALLSPGDTVGLLGKSGVGKSALVNALASGNAPDGYATGSQRSREEDGDHEESLFLAREGQVREDDLRGRHTTTSSHLYRLDSGILVIDSPGIRELKVLGDAGDISQSFPEIAVLGQGCRFDDCSHSGEPGCAVQAALDSGELDPDRYRAWKSLGRELDWIERRSDDRARMEHERKWKQISKLQKELKKRR